MGDEDVAGRSNYYKREAPTMSYYKSQSLRKSDNNVRLARMYQQSPDRAQTTTTTPPLRVEERDRERANVESLKKKTQDTQHKASISL